jgi:hypothetical protein
MLKELSEIFVQKEILCPKLESIDPKELGSRKKLKIYFGVDNKSYYCLILVISKKSRVLKKEAIEFEELWRRVKILKETNIKKKYIFLKAPICSKAKVWLEEFGWRVEMIAYDEIVWKKRE